MLDCQLFGRKAGPPHLVNVAFHIANALLLFVVLRRMTQAVWRSAAVAALFALHPWQVGTVAWVAERKNVLSGLFFMLTLWAYARYVEPSKVQSPKPKVWYGLALVCFALGLMSKTMLVTLPFVLLLLDYWPMRRFRPENQRSTIKNLLPLLLEKLPFLALSGAAVWVTLAGHERFSLGATSPQFPLGARLANALVSYGRYIAGTFWPTDMAVLYPFPDHWPVALVLGAGLALAGVSSLALWRVRRQPYLAVGWFWFLGTLIPVIGLVQDGLQAMADRYMYIPLIGLLLILCWGTAEIIGRLKKSGAGVAPAGLGGVAPPDRPGSRGRTPPLIRGRDTRAAWAASIAAFAIVGCAGAARHELQYWRNSLALFGRAVAVTRGNYICEEDLGVALAKSGAREEARAHIEEALRIKPDNPNAHFNLGLWLGMQGQLAEAAAQYREAIRLRPNYPKALNNLAWILATHPDPRVRDGEQALQLARHAAHLTGGNDPEGLDTLGAALAAAGRFHEAAEAARTAAGLARASGAAALEREIEAHRQCYERGQPFLEPSTPGAKSPD
jgi:Tfp pilus assembly protein PilF